MIVETTRFGALEVEPDAIIIVPRGLIGFPASHRFILIDHAPGKPFQWLQSADDPKLAFLVVDPYTFFPDYEIHISDEKAELLGINEPHEAQILATVTVRSAPVGVSLNLLGPLVIGLPTRQAVQLVLDHDRYSTRHPLPAPRISAGTRVLQPVS